MRFFHEFHELNVVAVAYPKYHISMHTHTHTHTRARARARDDTAHKN